MSSKRIYFAHSWSRWKTKQESQIIKILEDRGYIVHNPFDKEIELNKKYNINWYSDNPTKPHANDIYDIDFANLMECDAYFGWFSKNNHIIGTSIELAWAYYAELLGYEQMEIIVLSFKKHPFNWRMCDKFYEGYNNFKQDKPFYIRKGEKDCAVYKTRK